MGILSELRWVVGIHVAQKGLPPAIIAPCINILNELDKDLTITGYDVGIEVNKQIQRLKESIIMLNQPISAESSEPIDTTISEENEDQDIFDDINEDDDDDDIDILEEEEDDDD